MTTAIALGFLAYLVIAQAVAVTVLLVKCVRASKALRKHVSEEHAPLGIGA